MLFAELNGSCILIHVSEFVGTMGAEQEFAL